MTTKMVTLTTGIATFLLGRFLSAESAAPPSPETMWREAVSLYTTETDDYLDTVSDSLLEIKFWREKNLQEKFEVKNGQLEAILAKSNSEILKDIENYVAKNGIENLDDSLMMRVAQLNYEKANFELSSKMRKYQAESELFNLGKIPKVPELPSPDYTRVIYFTAELLHGFPNSPLTDSAHYLLAYCLFDEGKFEKAAQIYERMLKVNPYSDLVPEVKWRLAEYYFESEKYPEALKYYAELAASKSKFAQGALYKKGAILFTTGQLDNAAVVFKQLYINSSSKISGVADPASETLYNESLDYLAHLKGKGVYFQLDEDTDSLITEKLAEAYRKNDVVERERRTYLDYVAQHPLSKSSPRFMDRVIESYSNDAELGKAQNVRNKLIAGLNSTSPFWDKFRQDVSVVVDAQDLYEKHLISGAEFYADQAKVSKKQVDYRAAVSLFRKFLVEYPFSPLYGEAHFELAELQYELGHYKEAATTYLEVAADSDNAIFKDEAAYGYVLSQVKILKFSLKDDLELKPNRDESGNLTSPSSLSAEENAYLKIAQYFVNTVESGSRRQRVLYRAAEILFRHNKFAKARQALDLILQDKEPSTVTASAERLNTATYDLENNFEMAIQTDHRLKLVTQTSDMDLEEGSGLLKWEKNELVMASKTEGEGNFTDAASSFEQYAIEYPKANEAPAALFRSAILYRKVSQIEASNRVLDKVIMNYPTNPIRAKGEFLKVANLVSLLKFEEAAIGYEAFGKNYRTHPLSSQAFINATYLRRAMLQHKEAAEDFNQYAQRVRDDEVWFEAAGYFKMAHQFNKANQILQKYATPKSGRELFVRALFEQVQLKPSLVKKNCAIVNAVSKKYGSLLSAKAQHTVVGCSYASTWEMRDELLQANFKKNNLVDLAHYKQKFTELSKKYSDLQNSKDKIWLAEALCDAGRILDEWATKTKEIQPEESSVFSEKSRGFYGKAFTLFEPRQLTELEPSREAALNKAAKKDIVAQEMIWPNSGLSADLILAKWNSHISSLRVLFDQKNWKGLEIQSKANENIEGDEDFASLSMIQARALAEQGQWVGAQQSLVKCAERVGDTGCISSALTLGYQGSNLKKYKENLISALHVKGDASWSLALAHEAIRENQYKEALDYSRQSVLQDPQYPRSYEFMARLFVETQHPDLAQIVLSEGLRSTSDESLQIHLGYLYLLLGMRADTESLINELNGQIKISPEERLFLAHAYNVLGKKPEAINVLSVDPTNEPDNGMLLAGRFSLALVNKDEKTLNDLSKVLEAKWRQDPYATYLLGLYFQTAMGDNEQAEKFYTEARGLGAWGHWLNLGITNASSPSSREPAAKGSDK